MKSDVSRQNAVRVAALGGVLTCLLAMTPAIADSPGNSEPRIDVNFPNPQPPYPDAAQINGEQGKVVLDVRVLASGHVRSVRIAQSSGFDDLDNAAIEGVLRWHFVPAHRDGDTASEWTKVTIDFRLPSALPPVAPQPHPGPSSPSSTL